jgi:RNA polymerase sigma factor (sigma-70 family)
LHSFEGRSSIQEWLRSVGYHEVLRSIRRQKPTISLEDTTPDDPANPPNQEDEIWIEEIKKLFAEMACELTEHERQLLEFIKEGLKTGEIAALTGIDPGSVSKAKRRLLDKLEERIRTKLDGEAGAGKSGKNKPPEE